MNELTLRLITAAEEGNMQRVVLLNGEQLTGWIMEINDSQVIISTDQGDKQDSEHTINLSDIKPDSVEHWCIQADGWVKSPA